LVPLVLEARMLIRSGLAENLPRLPVTVHESKSEKEIEEIAGQNVRIVVGISVWMIVKGRENETGETGMVSKKETEQSVIVGEEVTDIENVSVTEQTEEEQTEEEQTEEDQTEEDQTEEDQTEEDQTEEDQTEEDQTDQTEETEETGNAIARGELHYYSRTRNGRVCYISRVAYVLPLPFPSRQCAHQL